MIQIVFHFFINKLSETSVEPEGTTRLPLASKIVSIATLGGASDPLVGLDNCNNTVLFG